MQGQAYQVNDVNGNRRPKKEMNEGERSVLPQTDKNVKNGHTYTDQHNTMAETRNTHTQLFLNELFCEGLEIIMIINVEQT